MLLTAGRLPRWLLELRLAAGEAAAMLPHFVSRSWGGEYSVAAKSYAVNW
jgi:hypothetical protein